MQNFSSGNALIDVSLITTKAEIRNGMHVADLGCGSTGFLVFPISRIVGNEGKVYAVDIMRTALSSIEKRKRMENRKNIETIWSNIEIFGATKIESSSLDVALLMNALYQSNKRPEIIREAVRMLKQEGKLVIVDWKDAATPFGPPSDARVHKENLIQGAKKLGLLFEEEFFVGQFHFGLIFTKI